MNEFTTQAVRDLTQDEKETRDEMFELAERFQGYIAGKLRQLLGEPAYDQRIFNAEERARRVEALKGCAYGPIRTPAERHVDWCKMHEDQGWVYGPEFRPDLKQHPNLLPWEQLPVETRVKADIFALVAQHTVDQSVLAFRLSKSPEFERIRILANLPLDENDVPEEVMSERLSAIAMLAEGNDELFKQEVLLRVQSIIEREKLDVSGVQDMQSLLAAFEEALTVCE